MFYIGGVFVYAAWLVAGWHGASLYCVFYIGLYASRMYHVSCIPFSRMEEGSICICLLGISIAFSSSLLSCLTKEFFLLSSLTCPSGFLLTS